MEELIAREKQMSASNAIITRRFSMEPGWHGNWMKAKHFLAHLEAEKRQHLPLEK